jgi:hypothetical protein
MERSVHDAGPDGASGKGTVFAQSEGVALPRGGDARTAG